jgi:hypothetical protein
MTYDTSLRSWRNEEKIRSLIGYWQIMDICSLFMFSGVSFIYMHTTKNLQVQCHEWKINLITLSHCQKLPTTKNMRTGLYKLSRLQKRNSFSPPKSFSPLSLASLKNGFNKCYCSCDLVLRCISVSIYDSEP